MDKMLEQIKELKVVADKFHYGTCNGVKCCNCPFDEYVEGADHDLCWLMNRIHEHLKEVEV